MSQSEDLRLIDRHLAGVLSPREEAQLEQLIRTSPEWARRYAEAEEMARLLGDALGPHTAPQRVKRAVARVQPEVEGSGRTRRKRRPAPRSRAWTSGRIAAVAIAAAVLIGVALFLPVGDEIVSNAYSAEPLPIKDLARSAHVALIGHVVDQDGRLGFRIDRSLFGDAESGIALPDSLRPGQRVALFGVRDRTGIVHVMERGVVHLDGRQAWEGRALDADETLARVTNADAYRTLTSALSDLDQFLEADASLATCGEDGLCYTADVTAHFLGRYPAHMTRTSLLRLVLDADKHPDARLAGGDAMVDSAPADGCQRLLEAILGGKPGLMRAESEDGYVILRCLQLIQRHGDAALAGSLETLAQLFPCPALKRTASDAALAVTGEGSRTPRTLPVIRPLRLEGEDGEGIVLSGCEGRREGLVVIFRDGQTIVDLRMAIGIAVGEGLGVVVLPDGSDDAEGWVQAAVETGHVSDQPIVFLGTGQAAAAVRRAAGHRAAPTHIVTADGPFGDAAQLRRDLKAR